MIFGRREERSAIEQAITDARLGSSRALVLRGEPGIGKTSLLEAAAEAARAEGMEVLSARGVESEAEVPFGGLLELVRLALPALERIPAAQAEALRSALAIGPTLIDWVEVCGRVKCPALVLHGNRDEIRPHEGGAALARALPGGRFVSLEGSGHGPIARDPVKVNLLVRDFVEPVPPAPVWRRGAARASKRALFVSSPIGLGHARRDVETDGAARAAELIAELL
jgi:pimeloyl-ACP methyl ester carboxylesterase